MDRDLDLIWRYIDGQCSADESREVENRLKSDPTFRKQCSEVEEMDALLSKRAPELPSLRFGKNVMDRISQIAPSTYEIPVISRRVVWGFFSGMAVLIAAALMIVISFPSLSGSLTFNPWEGFVSWIQTKPSSTMVFQIFIGLGVLFLLDRYLGFRYGKKSTNPV